MNFRSASAWLHSLLFSASLSAAVPAPTVTEPPSVTTTTICPPGEPITVTATVIQTITTAITVTNAITITTTLTAPGPTITTIPITTAPTTTTAVTTTVIPPTPTTTACSNTGLAYAVQEHNFVNRPAPAYPSLNVNYFKTAKPVQEGLTNGVGFVHNPVINPMPIYGGPARDAEYIAVNHRGYFVPQLTGTYTFQATNHDDMLLFWVGNKAFDGAYTRENADMEIKFQNSPPLSGSFSVRLTAGTPVPLRLLALNAQGKGWRGFTFTVKDPAGKVIVDQKTGGQHFVQFSCDGKLKAWKPFGKEA